jgi:hypothetical protein
MDFCFLGFYFVGLLSLLKKKVFSCNKVRTAEDKWREETDGQQSAPGGLVTEVLFQVDSVMF